jgi:hypothetical protein
MITVATPFTLGSAYIGSGWYDNLNVTVEGRLAGVLEFTQTITVSTTGAQLLTFDFTGIDEVDLFSTVTPATTASPTGPARRIAASSPSTTSTPRPSTQPSPTVPQPSTVVILLSSLPLLAIVRRDRRRPELNLTKMN